MVQTGRSSEKHAVTHTHTKPKSLKFTY